MALDTFAQGNAWVKAFYAGHTFEVDFIQSGNAFEVEKTLPLIYKNAQTKANSAALLQSEDGRASGLEILRLADKVGKGWFALTLADRLDVRTYFPDYILRAIAFACYPHVNDASLRRIGLYRLKEQGTDGPLAQAFAGNADLQSLDSADFVAAFRAGAPTDELSLFAQYIEEYRQ